jgi:hypothetical protein
LIHGQEDLRLEKAFDWLDDQVAARQIDLRDESIHQRDDEVPTRRGNRETTLGRVCVNASDGTDHDSRWISRLEAD